MSDAHAGVENSDPRSGLDCVHLGRYLAEIP